LTEHQAVLQTHLYHGQLDIQLDWKARTGTYHQL